MPTTTVRDLTRTAIGVGSGRLLSRSSYRQQIDPHIGFGHPQGGCERCTRLSRLYGYGLGVVRNGDWILQNPLFGGYAAIESYLPARRISIALATTFDASSFGAQGQCTKYWTTLYVKIRACLPAGGGRAGVWGTPRHGTARRRPYAATGSSPPG